MRHEALRPAEMLHRPDPENWDEVTQEPLEIELDFALADESVQLTGNAVSPGFDGTRNTSKIVLAYGPRRYFSARKTRRFAAPAYRVRSLFDPLATIENPLSWLLSCDERGQRW